VTKRKEVNIHQELLLIRNGNGVKLIKPSSSSPPTSVAHLMQLPLNIYFLTPDGTTLSMNEPCIESCGFNSLQDSIGKSLLDVSTQESATKLIHNCHETLTANQIKIFEELNFRKDGMSLSLLSVKAPWYDDNNKIIGTFGCSIVLGKHRLAQSLMQIAELGLLHPSQVLGPAAPPPTPKAITCKEPLSEREHICVEYLCKGFTIKEVAKYIAISPKTVETYLDRAKQKLGCQNKAELIAAFCAMN